VWRSATDRHFQLTPDTTRREFADLFEQITGHSLGEKRFRELETSFHAFRQQFTTAAGLEC